MKAQPQAHTATRFRGVCFFCFALLFDFFSPRMASNEIQRAPLDGMLFIFAAIMNNSTLLMTYNTNLPLTYIAFWQL